MPVNQSVDRPTDQSWPIHSLATPPFPPSSFLSRAQGCAPKPISSPFQSPRSISYFPFPRPFLPWFSRLLPPSAAMLDPHSSPLVNSRSHPLPNPWEKPDSTIPFPFSLTRFPSDCRAAFLYSARRSLSVTDGPEPSAYLSLWEPVTPVGLRHWHFCVWQMGEAVGNLLGASAAPGVKTHPTRPLSLSLNTVLGGRDAWSW